MAVSRKLFAINSLRESPDAARPLQFQKRGAGVHVITRKAGATDGFALIDLIFVCGIIGVLATIALPRMLLARQSAGAASAIGSMRAINSAELTFALTCGGGFYAPNLTTLGTPPPGSHEAYITANLGSADTVTRAG